MLGFYKDLILTHPEFNRVFDLFQMIMRHADLPTVSYYRRGQLACSNDAVSPIVIDTNEATQPFFPATTMQRKAKRSVKQSSISEMPALTGLRHTFGGQRNSSTRVTGLDQSERAYTPSESVARQLDPEGMRLANWDRR